MIKNKLKKFIGSLAGNDSVFNLFRYINRNNLLIIYYHRVIKKDELVNVKVKDMCVSINDFDAQMRFLSKYYKPVGEEEILTPIQKGGISKHSVWVTFDDGYKDNYINAYPILRKYKIPATFFITTGYINKKVTPYDLFIGNADLLFMSWNEIKELSRNGFSIGAHTVHHKILSTLSKKEMADEISNSKHEIEKRLGIKVSSFAYPVGKSSHYNLETCVAIMKEYGFKLAVTTIGGANNLISGANLFNLRRMGVSYYDSLNFFKFKVSSGSFWQR